MFYVGRLILSYFTCLEGSGRFSLSYFNVWKALGGSICRLAMAVAMTNVRLEGNRNGNGNGNGGGDGDGDDDDNDSNDNNDDNNASSPYGFPRCLHQPRGNRREFLLIAARCDACAPDGCCATRCIPQAAKSSLHLLTTETSSKLLATQADDSISGRKV